MLAPWCDPQDWVVEIHGVIIGDLEHQRIDRGAELEIGGIRLYFVNTTQATND
ncbi:MAG: hypothetical protein IH991_19040 [Planctomycetes bacterium]|nr:hypothetical protein [Planctomycetota bacterium]